LQDWTQAMLDQPQAMREPRFVPAAPAPARHIGRNITDRGYQARIADDAETRLDAYRLRYRSYHAQGHLAANATGLLHDAFDEQASTKIVVVYADGRAVGSIRTCFLRRGPGTVSPCRAVYPDEVERLLEQSGPPRAGFDGVEVNRMVRAPEAGDDQGLVFTLLRLAGYLALQQDFRVIVTCVRGHHVPFYRRLKFTEAGPPKIYPGLTCPMVLLEIGRANYDAMRQGFRLMDPAAGAPGLLDGLVRGQWVRPHLVRRS
jgi:N-acyl-L-homoserine lactone synthetase